MRSTLLFIASVLGVVLITAALQQKSAQARVADPNMGRVFSIPGDQVGRPGVNVVFISDDQKDKFNTTMPSAMKAAYHAMIRTKLLALNPNYTKNFLGLDAETFSGVLATDVLTVSLKGATSYYDGTNVLTGRKLNDDVIDFSLKLIFGGTDGKSNPGLSSDNVNKNDKDFSNLFPYEAAPW